MIRHVNTLCLTLGPHDKASRKGDALALTTRHLVRHAVFEPAKLYKLKCFGDAVAGFALRYSGYAQAVAHIVGHVHMREHGVALKHHVHWPLIWRDEAHILTVDKDLSLGRHFETSDHPQQGRLAAARGAKQHKKLTCQNIKADIVDSRNLSKTFGHVAYLDNGLFGFSHMEMLLLMGLRDALHALIFQRDEGQEDG